VDMFFSVFLFKNNMDSIKYFNQRFLFLKFLDYLVSADTRRGFFMEIIWMKGVFMEIIWMKGIFMEILKERGVFVEIIEVGEFS
jgi:hypothetical protein